jgi:threonine dehydratase
MDAWPITLDDVLSARERIRPHLAATPMRRYAPLDDEVGHGIRVHVKHENHQPTNAFKVRNALSALTRLSDDQRRRGVIAATRGNHGQGVAWAGARLGVPVVICVPRGNNPDKNRAVRGLGAELVEDGRDYDESVEVAGRIAAERGLHMVHSTNDRDIIAGAGTIALEMLEQAPELEAMVVAVGGGSQAVGALTVARALRPGMPVHGAQAARASAIHDGWHRGEPVSLPSADTFADGLATRHCYDMTFGALRAGLAGFVALDEAELATAVRLMLRATHNLAEGAGAAGLGGLLRVAPALAGRHVGVILSGANIDEATLAKVLSGAL